MSGLVQLQPAEKLFVQSGAVRGEVLRRPRFGRERVQFHVPPVEAVPEDIKLAKRVSGKLLVFHA